MLLLLLYRILLCYVCCYSCHSTVVALHTTYCMYRYKISECTFIKTGEEEEDAAVQFKTFPNAVACL